jgi:hypothetical protein
LGGLLLCLRVINVNPALITSDNPGQEGCTVRGNLTNLLTDADTLLLLITCQNPGHKFGSNTMHAQFSCQNPLACHITNSNLISKILNGSMSILTNKLLKFSNNVGHCAADGPTCVLVVLNECPTGPELSTPFKHPCMAQAFFPTHLSNHCQGLWHIFSEICTTFDAHLPFLCWIYHKITSGQVQDSK